MISDMKMYNEHVLCMCTCRRFDSRDISKFFLSGFIFKYSHFTHFIILYNNLIESYLT